MLCSFRTVIAVLLTVLAVPLAAQDLSRLVALDTLSQVDPQTALRETDMALRDPVVIGTPPDQRILMDLLRLRAELLEQLEQPERAGDGWVQLARIQTFARSALRADPVPAYQRAAVLYEQVGRFDKARGALERATEAERETGRNGAVLLQLFEEVARLAESEGNAPAATRARAQIEALSGPSFEFSGQAGGAGSDTGFAAVDVYYATDRARTGLQDPARFYANRRGNGLELGIATVTIPDTHVAGTVERPSVWRLEFRASASKHVLLKSVEPVDRDSFFGRLQGEFRGDAERDLFVYIHGFNHDFEYAAQRAAQLAYDMGNSAVPVLFSWPSRNTTVGYIADAAVVRLSGRRLAVFLEDLAAQSGADTIHVLAHSMGNRALTDALEIMALRRQAEPGDAPLFDQVMFAAPDVDSELFSAMARVFHPLARRMTLYASSNDWALVSSRKLHGSVSRAGLGGPLLLAADVFDSVDMTALGEDMLAHNYFSNDSSALADMMTLFWHDAPPQRRCGLLPRAAGQRTVWEYREGVCPSNDLIGLIANLRQQNIRDAEKLRVVVPSLLPQHQTDQLLPMLERVLLGG